MFVFFKLSTVLLFNCIGLPPTYNLDNTATFAFNYVIRCPVSGHVCQTYNLMFYPVFLCPTSGLLFNSLQVQGDRADKLYFLFFAIKKPSLLWNGIYIWRREIAEGAGITAELKDRLEINCTKERSTCGHLILLESVVYLTRYITKPSRLDVEPSRRTRFHDNLNNPTTIVSRGLQELPKEESYKDRLTRFGKSYEERILQRSRRGSRTKNPHQFGASDRRCLICWRQCLEERQVLEQR